MEELDALYETTCRETRRRWVENPDIGAVRAAPFHPTRLSLTTGNFFEAPAGAAGLLAGLRKMVQDDPLGDVVSPECAHLTFLSLSQPDYETVEDLPDLAEVRELFDRHCRGEIFTLRNLRLVALPNALLLAGSPDVATLARRAAFARDLLGSGWAGPLRARYPNGEIPPRFWHSTIARYHADFLPERWRQFYVENAPVRYGDATLEIGLLATNYHWSVSRRLDR